MALFQQSVIKKHLESFDAKHLEERWQLFRGIFHTAAKQQNIRNSKEEQYQEGFLRDLFVTVLGYTINPEVNFNLLTEQKNVNNSKKADGAILMTGSNGMPSIVAVIELKGTETTDLNKIEIQAFGYKNNQPGCNYVITSNFEKLRFYIDNTTQQEEFNLFTLTKAQFELLYACLAWESISKNTPMQILNESVSKENIITKSLYKDYSEFKRALFANLVEMNPQYDKLVLFKKTQKLLDRFLFIFFAEDRLLLPTNLIFRINKEWENIKLMRLPVSLYDRYIDYFRDLNIGAKVTLPAFGKKTGEAITAEFEIFAYNGGLFQTDDILDNIQIDDTLLHTYTQRMSNYNFESDVDVNILGHIFENSLNEIDEIKSEIEGNVLEKTKTRRKKDGVFYTPKYITKYIVDNTIGKLCTEKKEEIKLVDEDFTSTPSTPSTPSTGSGSLGSVKSGYSKTKKKALLDKLTDYRNWLLDLTICDPACGSGAFLNQALEFLIAEHRYVDELQAKLLGDSLILSDIENSILERNIYGVDLNDESVEIAKLSLWLRTAQKGRKLNSLNNNIKCGNSLIDDPAVAGDKAFSWEKEFPEVFKKGGFDVVIGNPPYVRQELFKEIKPYLEKNYECYNSIADLYTYFIEKGIDLLNENGLFSFILPNKFLKATYGKEIRNVIIKESNIVLLVDFDDFPVFPDATTYPLIFVLNKKRSIDFYYTSLDNRTETNDAVGYLEANKYLVKIDSLTKDSWSFYNSKIQGLLNKINLSSNPLKDVVDNKIFAGIASGKNDVFIINDISQFEKDLKARDHLKLILGGSEINRYSISPDNNHILFIPWDYNLDKSESIKNYLILNKESLEQRPEVEAGRFNWFCLSRYGSNNSHLLNQPKIIAPFINNKCNFYLDESGEIYLQKNSMFISSDSKSLLAYLNSKISFFYLKSVSTTLQGGYYDFRRDKIQYLPIPKNLEKNKIQFEKVVNNMTDLKNQEELVTKKFVNYFSSQYNLEKLPGKLEKWYDLEFVDFIKELNKAIKGVKGTPLTKKDEFEWMDLFEENKKKAQELKAEIDRTDKEIDNMVYELYELSEEEIKIVEGE
jgi:type I restriction-modification system DNA methylase subunit